MSRSLPLLLLLSSLFGPLICGHTSAPFVVAFDLIDPFSIGNYIMEFVVGIRLWEGIHLRGIRLRNSSSEGDSSSGGYSSSRSSSSGGDYLVVGSQAQP